MKQLVRYSADILFKNWATLLLFDIAYKIFSYSIFYSIVSDLLSLLLKTAGVAYLSPENLRLVLTDPLAIFLCLGILVLVAVSVLFETVALFIYCEAGWQQQRLSMVSLLKRTLFQCKKLLRIKNILLLFGFVLASILTILPFSPYILQWLRVPEFVMEVIKQSPLLFFLYGSVAVFANLICFLFLFALPLALFFDRPIKKAWKESQAL